MSRPIFRLTSAQEAIWNAIQLSADPSVWVVCELSIYEASASDVADAARRVVSQVPVLYTRVHHGEGQHSGRIVQTRTNDPMDRVILVPDIEISATSDPSDVARMMLDSYAPSMAATIDVPLFLMLVFPLGAGKSACVQMYNHIVIDGYGASLIHELIEREIRIQRTSGQAVPYNSCNPGKIAPDELVAEELYRTSEKYAIDWDFWRSTLDVELKHPYRSGREIVDSLSDSRVFDQLLMGSLTQTAKAVGCHQIEILTGLYVGFVAYRLGVDKVTFAMPFSNRVRFPTLATVPCMLVNVLPIQIAIGEGTESLFGLASRTAELLREVGKHSRFRGEELIARVDGADGRLLAGIGINIRTFFSSKSGAQRVSIATGPREPGGLQIDHGPTGELIVSLPRTADCQPGEPSLDVDDFVRFCQSWLASPGLALREVPLFAEAQREVIGALHTTPRIALDRVLRGDLIGRMPQVPLPMVTFHGESGSVRSLPSTDLFIHVQKRRRYLESVIQCPELTAVVAGRGFETVVTILAMLQAQHPFTLIDQEHPPARIRQILELAKPKFIVRTDSSTTIPVPAGSVGGGGTGGGIEVFLTADFDSRPAKSNEDGIDWAENAYVIFTSGSTGVPKGVTIGRSALERFLSNQISTLHNPGFCGTRRAAAPSRAAITASFGFDAFYEQLCFLLVGYNTHVYSETQRRDPEELALRLAADQIDIIDLTPSHAQALLTAGLWTDAYPGPTTVLLGGEAVPKSLWQRLRPHTDVLANTYGPTENTVDTAIFYEFPGEPPEALESWQTFISAPIGRFLSGVGGLVVNDLGVPVRPGEVGELVVYGDQLMAGYLSGGSTIDPNLRQIVNETGAYSVYATGDLVWIDDANGLVFASRNDRQVQIRGNRVDLAEVEKSLLALSHIQHCAARVSFDNRLEAVVVLATVDSADVTEIRRQLAEYVPASHVPAHITAVDSLRYTVNGKIDWDAVWVQVSLLREQPNTLNDPIDNDLVVGPGHEVLAETVREVLAEQFTGSLMAATFLELGGDSLSTIDVVARMHVRGWRVAAAELRGTTRLIDLTVTRLGEVPDTRHNRGFPVSQCDWIGDGPNLMVEIPPIAIVAWEAAGRDLEKLLRFCYAQVYSIEVSPAEVRDRLEALSHSHPLLTAKVIAQDRSDSAAVPMLMFRVAAEDSHEGDIALRIIEFVSGTEPERALKEVWAGENSEHQVFAAGIVPRPGGGTSLILVVSHLVMDPVSWRIVERAVVRGEGLAISPGARLREIDWYGRSKEIAEQLGDARGRRDWAASIAERRRHGRFLHTSHRLDFNSGLPFVRHSSCTDLLGGDLLDIVVVAVVRALGSRPTGVQEFLSTSEILLESHGRTGIPHLGLRDETGIGWYAFEWPVAVDDIISAVPTPWDLNAWHSSISTLKIRRTSTPIEKKLAWGYRLSATNNEPQRPHVLLNFLGVQSSKDQASEALPRVLGEDHVTNDCITLNCWFEKTDNSVSMRIEVTGCECHAGTDLGWLLGPLKEYLVELSEMISHFDLVGVI